MSRTINPASVYQLVNVIVAAATTLFAAKFAGPGEWGIVAAINSVVAFGCTVATLGIPIDLAKAVGKGQESAKLPHLVTLTVSALVTALVVASFWSQSQSGSFTFWTVTTLIAFLTLTEGFFAVIQGRGALKQLAWLRVLSVAIPGLSVCLASLVSGRARVMLTTLLAATILVCVFVIGYVLARTRNETKPTNSQVLSGYFVSRFKPALVTYFSSVLVFLAFRLDMLVGAWTLEPAKFAEYNLSVLASEILWVSANGQALSSLVENHLSKLSKREAAVNSLSRKAFRSALLLTVLSAPGFLLLSLYFGQGRFENVSMLFYLQILGTLAFIRVKIFLSFEIAQGRLADIIKVTSVCLIAKSLGLFVAPFIGAVGLALATCFAYLLSAFWVTRLLKAGALNESN